MSNWKGSLGRTLILSQGMSRLPDIFRSIQLVWPVMSTESGFNHNQADSTEGG